MFPLFAYITDTNDDTGSTSHSKFRGESPAAVLTSTSKDWEVIIEKDHPRRKGWCHCLHGLHNIRGQTLLGGDTGYNFCCALLIGAYRYRNSGMIICIYSLEAVQAQVGGI